jgi:hypothetical protein
MVVPGKASYARRRHEMTSQRTAEKRDREGDVVNRLVDIAGQLGRLLEKRTLEPQKMPFEGFRSPPGRF